MNDCFYRYLGVYFGEHMDFVVGTENLHAVLFNNSLKIDNTENRAQRIMGRT